MPDVLATVLSRFHDLSETSVARRLAAVPIGPTSLWDAVRYDVADAIFDEAYRERHPQPQLAPSAIRTVVTRNLWQAQLGQEFLVGVLSARLGLVGDIIERGLGRYHRVVARDPNLHPVDVLVAGSMYRRAVAALAPVLGRLDRHEGLRHLVVAHDDLLLRHARVFSRAGLRWRQAAVFSNRSQQAEARTIVDRTRGILADVAASRRAGLPAVVLQRALSARHVRRLVLNFLAVERALAASAPLVVVIPDERQPLARLVGLLARLNRIPVVSAPLDRDQIYRKTPIWDRPVSTRVLVSSALALRFLSRAGAPPDLFAVARTHEGANPIVLADQRRVRSDYRKLLRVEERSRIVLFASQGLAQNAVLLPRLAACIGAMPGVTLVIRPHPYEWPPLVRLMNRGLHVSTAMSASEAILAADILVTHSSYTAVDAALLGRPVVLVSVDGIPNLLPLITEGLARWARTSEDLQRALIDLLQPDDGRLREDQDRFRAQQPEVGGIGHAAEVIAGLARASRRADILPLPSALV